MPSFNSKIEYSPLLQQSFLSSSLFEKIRLENRFKFDKGNDCLLAVDGITTPIVEPRPFIPSFSRVWYDEKTNGPGLVYEVATSILGGEICWVNGPFPCGAYNDWKIFKECGLKDCLEPNERVEADDGYIAGAPEYTKTRSSVFVSKEAGRMRRRVRARHEVMNGKLKAWKILSTPFRHGRHRENNGPDSKGLSSHQDAFYAVAVITQTRIKNGEIEVFSCEHYNDTFNNYDSDEDKKED